MEVDDLFEWKDWLVSTLQPHLYRLISYFTIFFGTSARHKDTQAWFNLGEQFGSGAIAPVLVKTPIVCSPT
jgi:hypothetical protein